MRFLFFICTLLILSLSCNSANDKSEPQGEVELYLLADHDITNETDREIVSESVELQDTPFLSYADLLNYNSSEYEFSITDNARSRIENMENSVRGVPFGVVANNELIYTGYFWPSFSSLICKCLVIDPVAPTLRNENKLKMKLGYPGFFEGIDDNRNDPKVIDIFSRDDKLID